MDTTNQDTFASTFEFKTDWKTCFEDEDFVKVFSSDILENYIINKRWYGGKASTLKYIDVVDFFKIASKKNTTAKHKSTNPITKLLEYINPPIIPLKRHKIYLIATPYNPMLCSICIYFGYKYKKVLLFFISKSKIFNCFLTLH